MKRSSVRRLFVVVLVALPVQYALVGVVGLRESEPWPAVVMPGFKSVYDGQDTLAVPGYQLEVVFADPSADGPAREAVPVGRLLAPLPASHYPAFLSHQCRPARRSGTAATERCRRPAARRWFAQRLDALYPERDARRLDVIWGRYYRTPGAPTRYAPRDTLSLSLRP